MARKRSVFCIYLYLFSFITILPAYADQKIETRVHDLIIASDPGEPTRVFSTADGRVYDVDSRQADLVASLLRAQAQHASVELTLDNEGRIVASRQLAAEKDEAGANGPTIADSHGLGYQATNLAAMSDADSLFDSLMVLKPHSQCYQRAHVWARQMFEERSVYSMKVFLFFTRLFIQQHHYKWWFHVAPFVYVQGQEVVLDPEFVRAPKPMHDWTDVFMMDRGSVRPPLTASPECTEVASYSDYDNNQMAQDCYTLKLPMYYYQPLDAEKLAEDGTRVDGFRDWDVQHSRGAIP